jgi:hypothetical protein
VTDIRENGFEYQSRFYPWHIGDTGKDLMLIDRFTGLSISEFFEAVDDAPTRGGILLALVATSLRHGNPSWSVDRIFRLVSELSLSEDVEFVNPGSEEDTDPRPPAPPPPSGEPSKSQNNGSSPSSTLPAVTASPTSSVAPT